MTPESFKRIIQAKRSIVVAADVNKLVELVDLLNAIRGVRQIGAVKIGMGMGVNNLYKMVDIAKSILGNEFPLIYDHQKAGNDIPSMGEIFAGKIKRAGINSIILFPLAGPETQEAWTGACFEAGLNVLTGGIMTHPKFLVSEGGYIADDAPERIYRLACNLGVRHFVVPGNKLNWVIKVRGFLESELGEGNFVLYAPGFITQKGDISECGQIAGEEWHAIVGSAIYGKKTRGEMKEAAVTLTKMIG